MFTWTCTNDLCHPAYIESTGRWQQRSLGIYNNVLAMESSWDDALPLTDAWLQLWDSLTEFMEITKIFRCIGMILRQAERFINVLDTSDTLVISSNRQWATTTRVDERYPLTIAYYRNLLGCPADKDLLWCYRVAAAGNVHGITGLSS